MTPPVTFYYEIPERDSQPMGHHKLKALAAYLQFLKDSGYEAIGLPELFVHHGQFANIKVVGPVQFAPYDKEES